MQLWKRRASGPVGLLLFAFGFAAGLVSPRDMLATSAPPSSEVLLTAGDDFESHRVPVPPWPPSAKEASPPESSQTSTLSPRKIAERALEFTALIRGKGAYGAGVLMDERGHVLTCLHVLSGLDRAEVTFTDGESGQATVIDRDSALDLALLKLSKPRSGGVGARTASIVDTFTGDEVFAMGTPRKMSFSLSRGIVSYVGRGFQDVFYVQTDLPLNGGSSGGPLLNERGELIGISSFILRDSQGLAFALPIDYALSRFSKALGTRAEDKAFKGWLSQRGPNIAIQ